ncbi:GNAT family N-acetyltransferase [Nocardioides xinjiangensis]|uniref:GNAT family N-acetyltransferase n=1 Tax=Nocardioides xinjiangensis TaxID=2817376 RepID=UPI001B311149|nr:GNAT family N-acetyltransferase [Nocardioides sp. SYSU D00514]
MHISRADFTDPRLAAFLQAHLDDMEPTAPPESRHALDLTALQADHVRLWVAVATRDDDGADGADGDRSAGAIVGTAALAGLTERHEELKSMRTEPRSRGRGVATALLAHVLDDARARGVERVSLETGSMAFFEPARRFYAAAGFVPCPPFGSYVEDPNSTFMTLTLSRR